MNEPPDEIALYEESSAETRTVINKQLDHHNWLDRQDIYLSWAGLLSGFVIAIAFLISSALLIAGGHELGGTILGTVDLVALTAVFVVRRRDT